MHAMMYLDPATRAVSWWLQAPCRTVCQSPKGRLRSERLVGAKSVASCGF